MTTEKRRKKKIIINKNDEWAQPDCAWADFSSVRSVFLRRRLSSSCFFILFFFNGSKQVGSQTRSLTRIVFSSLSGWCCLRGLFINTGRLFLESASTSSRRRPRDYKLHRELNLAVFFFFFSKWSKFKKEQQQQDVFARAYAKRFRFFPRTTFHETSERNYRQNLKSLERVPPPLSSFFFSVYLAERRNLSLLKTPRRRKVLHVYAVIGIRDVIFFSFFFLHRCQRCRRLFSF